MCKHRGSCNTEVVIMVKINTGECLCNGECILEDVNVGAIVFNWRSCNTKVGVLVEVNVCIMENLDLKTLIKGDGHLRSTSYSCFSLFRG